MVAPFDQANVYGAVPPAGVKLIEPVLPPLHKISTLVDVNVNGAAGCEITIVATAAQEPESPFAS